MLMDYSWAADVAGYSACLALAADAVYAAWLVGGVMLDVRRCRLGRESEPAASYAPAKRRHFRMLASQEGPERLN